ncbi:alpha-2-macroglobulin-like protein 1 isoform X2 [Pimephales promelas]|uniref:alpha-2-macroglobulin-like protein 1 isoform X2 n=1 Tax=Pimephales promelas TaxID=90988 RepID=UPI001955F43A|nr:alpha-2-macroglobulin-like protein 1 isoform X2 [Pimephales promelas]
MIYMVLSKGVIVLHGFQTVKAKAGDSVASGSVTFQLSVSVDMAPAVQIQVHSSVPPSENVVAASVPFDTDMCFQNQVSLQFSPGKRSDGSLLPQCCRSEPTDHGARETSERLLLNVNFYSTVGRKDGRK